MFICTECVKYRFMFMSLHYEDLSQIFPPFFSEIFSAGSVSFVELFEDRDGKSLGCGLVEYSCAEEVEKAIDTLNNSKVNGREIKVKQVIVQLKLKSRCNIHATIICRCYMHTTIICRCYMHATIICRCYMHTTII